jgi:hypothetical protein
MTLFDLILGERGPAWLLGAVLLAAVLTLVAAALEIALERAGGPEPSRLPDWFAEHGPVLFVFVGLPALLVAVLATAALTLALGGNPERAGIPFVVPVLLDLAVIVAVLALGAGGPTTQHWGLAIAVFGACLSAMFPLLFMADRLPFRPDGGLDYPERFVFALVNGLILLTQVLASAALISLAVSAARTYNALRGRRPHPVRFAHDAPSPRREGGA